MLCFFHVSVRKAACFFTVLEFAVMQRDFYLHSNAHMWSP